MIEIKIPKTNTNLKFEQKVNIFEILKSAELDNQKNIIAAKINGVSVDLSYMVEDKCEIEFIEKSTNDGLEVIRHSTAHLMAQAILNLYPDTKIAIGPVIENGFYYDISSSHKVTEDDLSIIEKEMKRLVKARVIIKRQIKSKEDAINFFSALNQDYKVKIIKDIEEDFVSLYEQGDFVDLCKGPHVPNTGYLKSFKLTKVAGAYWKGDSNNEMLQRIYGVAFSSKEDLEKHMNFIEEAKQRDHRRLAQTMDLFHFQKEAPGMCFWHPNGTSIYSEIQKYILSKLKKHNYQDIKTPLVVDKSLWEKSGHWSKFKNEMFVIEDDKQTYAIKPMNCPCHVQVCNHDIKSYKDLPIRLSEFGSCHRNEYTGALHGLMRLKNFTIDDAHIFCTEDQIQDEVSNFIDLLYDVYKDFGFNKVLLKLATRPNESVGTDEMWFKSETSLTKALTDKDLDFEISEGDGAFYGPKIEFSLEDCLGRVWQCGTIQVDFSMPERLGANYIDKDNTKKPVVMLHRAIIGSFERFIGILLENHAGKLPLWLAPIQIAVLSVTEQANEICSEINDYLQLNSIRTVLDLRNEKIGYKIREHTLSKVPNMIILGKNEIESGDISVRKLNGETEKFSDKSELLNNLNKLINDKI